MDEIIFDQYRDPFRAFNIHMSIICDLEQGGKITEEEAVHNLQNTGIHESEWRCYLYNDIDYYIKNTGSIEELYNKIKMIF